jgi:release factor glutamine methyltransferase
LKEAGIEMPRLEAELLMAHVCGVSRLEILRGMDRELTPEEIEHLEELLSQRARRVPLAYLLGSKEFYGLSFLVTPNTLIPRPETELLVDFAIETFQNHPQPRIVDVGTGSGCIAVAVATHLPQARILAIDISAEALRVAKRNAKRHHVEGQILFVKSHLLECLAAQRADLILANPPYIPTHEIESLPPEVRDYEPRIALEAGAEGLAFHQTLIQEAPRVLVPGGWLGLEVALGQAAVVAEKMRACGLGEVSCRRDLAKVERMVVGRKEPMDTHAA